MTKTSPERPRGRDETVAAVLAAAERLFDNTPPDEVSLRAIAEEAGITYSLVHRHLGSKAAIVDEMLSRSEGRWRERIEGLDVGHALEAILGPTSDAGPYLRLLAWAVLGGEDRLAAQRTHWALRELVPLAQEEFGISRREAEDRLARALALILGWRFFNAFICDSLELGDDGPERLHGVIADAIRESTPT